MRRVSLLVALIVASFLAGLIVSGRMVPRGSVDAQDIAQTTRRPVSNGLPDTSGLPDLADIAERAMPSVVNISVASVQPRRMAPGFPFFLFEDGAGAPPSAGSGVIISRDGVVVTNAHVLGTRPETVTVILADRRERRAEIVGVDPYTDLAVLRIDAQDLTPITWGDSSRLRVAEWVMAIGNPYQLGETVTLGIVSAVGRTNAALSPIADYIQTDAAINPGNSGGALVNRRGELVGINTWIFTETGGYQGIGFAVPSNLVRRIVDELRQYGEVRRGSIGYLEVAPLTTGIAEQLRAPSADGVVVMGMRQGPAARAGIEPYDIILSVNGQRVMDTSSLLKLISDAPIGGTVTIDVLREGQRRTFKVPVEQQGRRPVQRGRGRQ
jgi:S1-C subfamily serine protease